MVNIMGWLIRSASGLALLLPIAASAESQGANVPESLRATVERLAAIEDIKLARIRFCRAIDNRDWAALNAVLTDDVSMRLSSKIDSDKAQTLADMQGRENVVKFTQNLLGEKMRTIHLVMMPDIAFDGPTHAHAKWWIDGYGDLSKADAALRERLKGKTGVVFEELEEDYVKIGGKWLIQKIDTVGVATY
ncbi:nuclear transport factor 2 family protein [Sphingomonas sp. CL5.1]|uniref:nuclear transport factor 2 family protein n=1 Tax=Sphingomonas sp. CL5.1 TaxID=2653203 RepID=UPI0015826639|nr:nuclear transport factor 2 family protein [Sphingomonas sp. CL5.1]QKS00601.1 nuclear transport factor 2 family protein [Sphingomonas sp. CL5.1]